MDKPSSERKLPTAPRSIADPASELRNLQANGSASLSELREFLAGLKGRKPQEVIGIVSASLLFQSLALSCLATIAILAVFTVGPYLVYGPPKPKEAAAKPAAATSPPAAATDAKAATPHTSPATPATQPDAAKAAKVMGLDETKAADPKKNPLDKPNIDNLLDGLDK